VSVACGVCGRRMMSLAGFGEEEANPPNDLRECARPNGNECLAVAAAVRERDQRIAALEAEVEAVRTKLASAELARAQADERRMAWMGQDEDPGVDHDAVVDLTWELWFDVGEPNGKDAGPRDCDRAQAWKQIVDARMGQKENEE
jgi:uncharacterized small protein (DUF1192 family)